MKTDKLLLNRAGPLHYVDIRWMFSLGAGFALHYCGAVGERPFGVYIVIGPLHLEGLFGRPNPEPETGEM